MERPILFNTEMTKDILEGRKTQTRRIIKPQPVLKEPIGFILASGKSKDIGKFMFGDRPTAPCKSENYLPPCYFGDILWVRETWKTYVKRIGKGDNSHLEKFFGYKTDESNPHNPSEFYEGKWRPSIHMPREAARLFLRVTNVRVERLQDIAEEDAKAEGINQHPIVDAFFELTNKHVYGNKCRDTAKAAFENLWDNIYAPKGYEYGNEHTYGWLENPWVWVIEFEKV